MTESPLNDEIVSTLRGAAPIRPGRTVWLSVAIIALVIFAVVLVVSFLSAANDNARIERMKSHGIPVTLSITNCVGNLGGSGSNVANYTCQGSYTIKGVTYQEIIGGKSTYSPGGAHVRGVADPLKYTTVELASALNASKSSSTRYVAPGILTAVFVALVLSLFSIARRMKRRNPIHE